MMDRPTRLPEDCEGAKKIATFPISSEPSYRTGEVLANPRRAGCITASGYLSYFFCSPFLNAAVVLLIVTHASRKLFMNSLTSINTWSAGALVALMRLISFLFQVLFQLATGFFLTKSAPMPGPENKSCVA